jgi:hypothetical protein
MLSCCQLRGHGYKIAPFEPVFLFEGRIDAESFVSAIDAFDAVALRLEGLIALEEVKR